MLPAHRGRVPASFVSTPMLRTLPFPLLLLLPGHATAQTTGVPGVNDLEVRLPVAYVPQGSGATSCNNLGFYPGAPFPVFYDLSSGGFPNALLFGLAGCTSPGIPFLPAAAPGCAGPLAGAPLTNIWLSLVVPPAPLAVPGNPNAAGISRWNFTVPAGPFTLWAQAIILDPCAPPGFKFSQAQGFSF